jgi:lactate racemase
MRHSVRMRGVADRKSAGRVVGRGGADVVLTAGEVREIVEEALRDVAAGTRVLAVIPDRTRDDDTHITFPIAAEILGRKRAARLDAIVAQGTHAPMSEAEKRVKIGAESASANAIPLLREIFDHRWNEDAALAMLGEISAPRVRELSEGLLAEPIAVRINALVARGGYDLILVFGATTPHEVAGFSGGAKYFFPGIAGPELTHMAHWLGAMATIERVIGRVETPTRHMIEAAAEMIPVPIVSLNSIVTREAGELKTRGIFAGEIREAFRSAAAVSAEVHIRYTGRKYRRVVAILDEHYDELWVGGKASYKLGGVIETGGELIIYAPRMKAISRTHGTLIEKYGYAPLEQVREMVLGSDELRANLAVAAHLAHVSYGSRVGDGGAIGPRFRIVLASGISEEACKRVRLGYMNPAEFDRAAYERDPDTLVVEQAGRDLYLVERENTTAAVKG